MIESILQAVRHEVWRILHQHKTSRPGIITSVDPDTYSAKVIYQPHDPNDPDNGESGWIPVQAVASGQGYGIFAVPHVGAQVDVAFQDGDHESGRIVQRHASEAHQPPVGMKEGETHIIHANGAVMRFLQDGTVFIGGAGTVPNRGAKDAATGRDGQSTTQQPQALQSLTMRPDGSWAVAHKSGGSISMDKDGNVTVKAANKGVTVDAGTGSVTYKAKSHAFQGDLAVTGGLTASGVVKGSTVTNGARSL